MVGQWGWILTMTWLPDVEDRASMIQGVTISESELAIAHSTVCMVEWMMCVDGWTCWLINGWICQQLELT
jgi:hypothetical protein